LATIGHGPPGLFNHKRNVPQQIPDVTNIGASDFQIYTDNPNAYTWTDGTPIISTNTTIGIYKNNLGEGLQLAVPASTSLQRLKIYIGAYAAQGRLEATLNDFSAAPFIDNSVSTLNTTSAVYTIIYSSATVGKKLTVKYTSSTLFDDLYGNVTLQAGSLSSALPKLTVLNSFPPGTFGFSFLADRDFSYLVEAENTLSQTNWQTLTNYSGTGSDVIYSEPINSNRWYRVKLGP